MTDYKCYVFSTSIVARVGNGTTERLTIDGTWEAIPTGGKFLPMGALVKG